VPLVFDNYLRQKTIVARRKIRCTYEKVCIAFGDLSCTEQYLKQQTSAGTHFCRNIKFQFSVELCNGRGRDQKLSSCILKWAGVGVFAF